MLDTLLQIGKILRESKRLRHHRYIKPAPKIERTKTGSIKTDVVYLVLPVREDFTFDFDNLETDFHNENIIPDFYYLAYKSADADSSVKYLWGDISYWIDKKGKEQGSYRIDETKNAFMRANKDAIFFVGTAIEKFRKSFEVNRERIENLLKENSNEKVCYLHFDFQKEKKRHWYKFEEEIKIVNRKFLQDFIGEKQKDRIVLRKNLYKTLASPEKNLPFPNFSASNIYKTRTFQSEDEVLDLIYAINYSTRAVITERDIKIIILPRSENLSPEQIENFFERKTSENSSAITLLQQKEAEKLLEKAHKKGQKKKPVEIDRNKPDELFEKPLELKDAQNNKEIEFDFIFSKAGGMTAPDVDLIELSGIKQSHLAKISERIIKIRNEVLDNRKKVFPNFEQGMEIKKSFSNILEDVTEKKKKYQSHLLKVLPQIYTGNYYRDDMLLPAFIEKTEYNIRQDKENFNFLKFDYEFLVKLKNRIGDENMENDKIANNEIEDMFNSSSYKAGELLGRMSKPVSREINSFQKNYVGQLSRRIADLDSLMDFTGFICEKLAIHDKLFQNIRDDFNEFINRIKENPKGYDRRYFAVGFFEGYLGKFEKTENEGETNNE